MAVFTWVPFDAPSVTTRHHVQITEFESGKEQRALLGRLGTQWTLTFKVSFATMLEIKAFYDARGGPFEAFTWVDPYSGETKTVRFAEDNLSIESEYLLNGLFEIKLQEVL